MRGPRIPAGKRVINSVAPLNPADFSEANANNLMFLYDNLGTAEYIEDSAILTRHILQLHAREQASPNLTLEVLAGVGWFTQNTYQAFAGGNSPAFAAPGANPRIDILTLRNDNTLHVIAGTEAASPVPPSIPSSDIPLAQVYNVVGQTTIHDNDTQVAGQGFIQFDLRPFIQVAVGASAMPKIGLVTKYSTSTTTTLVDVVNFAGAGRFRALQWSSSSPASLVHFIDIIIDGITFLSIGPVTINAAGEDFIYNSAGSATVFVRQAATATSRIFLDTFFKSSIQIRIKTNSGGVTVGAVAELETE